MFESLKKENEQLKNKFERTYTNYIYEAKVTLAQRETWIKNEEKHINESISAKKHLHIIELFDFIDFKPQESEQLFRFIKTRRNQVNDLDIFKDLFYSDHIKSQFDDLMDMFNGVAKDKLPYNVKKILFSYTNHGTGIRITNKLVVDLILAETNLFIPKVESDLNNIIANVKKLYPLYEILFKTRCSSKLVYSILRKELIKEIQLMFGDIYNDLSNKPKDKTIFMASVLGLLGVSNFESLSNLKRAYRNSLKSMGKQ